MAKGKVVPLSPEARARVIEEYNAAVSRADEAEASRLGRHLLEDIWQREWNELQGGVVNT